MFGNPKTSKAGGAGGSVQIGEISINVNVAGGANASASDIANETARAVASQLPGAIESALALMALQTGGSS
jgi:hypothetical protein